MAQANKFGARKVKEHGYTFDSQLEHSRYCQLRMLAMAGEIDGLIVHPKYMLHEKYRRPRTGESVRAITYTADFSYLDLGTGLRVVEDIKSPPTAKKEGFILRRKLFEVKYMMPITVLFKKDIE